MLGFVAYFTFYTQNFNKSGDFFIVMTTSA